MKVTYTCLEIGHNALEWDCGGMKKETPECFVQHPEKREKVRTTETRKVRRVDKQSRELSKRSYKGHKRPNHIVIWIPQ